ncbi:hypothetical protein BCR44DRAFT_24800 [Catenaria anguillulae PL171]|uniref:Uncharacterized protein n=1 Tax=Catenaria anguillulae PL171 TaxID=765915 RepID=A0A1Y2HPW2_9FUNG|nr:hypothetical protein BCR44DRAFT_24800 [Catenaria anguillulae PL171]
MSIKVVDFGNLAPSESGRTQIRIRLCPGSSFVTRLDYETNVFKNFGGPFLNGVRVYCSDNGPPFSIHYLITSADPSTSTLAQVEGKVSPNGIRETFVYADKYVNMLGYPGSFAGQSSGNAWQQARSEVAGCLLKGVELHYVEWVDGMRLHFDCASPSPPVPSPQPIPSPVTVTVILPPPTPVTSTVVVGSGQSASTIVTVVMLTPTPVTITLPSGPQAIITAPGATTTLFTTDTSAAAAAAAEHSSWRSSLLIGLLAGLAIILAGVILALLVLFVRQRRNKPPRERADPVEMASVASPPLPADVDPPAYLAVPIPRVDFVDVPLEPASLEGKVAGDRDCKGQMADEFEEVQLDSSESGSGAEGRNP